MDLLKPGSHHSTFAGNPLGARVASTMLKLIKEDGLAENACAMGALLRDGLLCTFSKDDMPVLRGRGLLWACKIDPRKNIIKLFSTLKLYINGQGSASSHSSSNDRLISLFAN